MSQMQPRIAIVGGGPGGLTLGALLHQRRIPFTIFELRPRPTEAELAEPSGMLDLHEESGLAAIRACGLYEQFLPLTGECEEAMIVADKHGKVLHSDQGGAADRPEISRHNIIRLLLSKIPEDSVQYGTKLLSSDRDATTGQVTLRLQPNSGRGAAVVAETYDLVVGADGAWSKVRPILSDVKPQPSGLQYMTLLIRDIATRYPHLASMVGRGTFLALGNKHGLDSHRAAQGSAQIYLITNALGGDEAAKAESLSRLRAPELRDHFLSDRASYGDWAPALKELIAAAFDGHDASAPAPLRPLSMLPVGHRWEARPGATLIGDAAHLMTPFAGEGVNLAMRDALELAGAVAGAWAARGPGAGRFAASLAPLLRAFEEAMFARARGKAEETRRNLDMMFGEGGAQALADLMKSFFEAGPPQ